MNIRFSPSNNWLGQVGEDNGFCVFESEDYSYRAAFRIIQSYGKRGIRTIANIVRTYAPPCENPTRTYIMFVCAKMEQLGYEACDVEMEDSQLDLNNGMVVADLIYCMVLFETGRKIQLKSVHGALRRMGCIVGCDDDPLPIPTIVR